MRGIQLLAGMLASSITLAACTQAPTAPPLDPSADVRESVQAENRLQTEGIFDDIGRAAGGVVSGVGKVVSKGVEAIGSGIGTVGDIAGSAADLGLPMPGLKLISGIGKLIGPRTVVGTGPAVGTPPRLGPRRTLGKRLIRRGPAVGTPPTLGPRRTLGKRRAVPSHYWSRRRFRPRPIEPDDRRPIYTRYERDDQPTYYDSYGQGDRARFGEDVMLNPQPLPPGPDDRRIWRSAPVYGQE